MTGRVGLLREVFFDDRIWLVRHLVVDLDNASDQPK